MTVLCVSEGSGDQWNRTRRLGRSCCEQRDGHACVVRACVCRAGSWGWGWGEPSGQGASCAASLEVSFFFLPLLTLRSTSIATAP